MCVTQQLRLKLAQLHVAGAVCSVARNVLALHGVQLKAASAEVREEGTGLGVLGSATTPNMSWG